MFLAGESFFHPILSWTPFYSWIRLGVHLYLVLPGQQGSVYLYRRYLHPWLDTHEREIDHFISESHDKAKKAGLGYIETAIEMIKTKVFGLPPKQPPPPPSATASYSQSLLSRFAMPNARPAGFPAGGASDLLGMLGNVMQQATAGTSTSREAQAADLSASGHLIPAGMSGAERSNYISAQREQLNTLLRAFDKAATEGEHGAAAHGSASPPGTFGNLDSLKKSRSEAEFEDLSNEYVPAGARKAVERTASWGKWIWGEKQGAEGPTPVKKEQ